MNRALILDTAIPNQFSGRPGFEAIKASLISEQVPSAAALRLRVQEYEDLLRTVSGSPGYRLSGNVRQPNHVIGD